VTPRPRSEEEEKEEEGEEEEETTYQQTRILLGLWADMHLV
jgi:hypothetical protein